MPYIKYFFIVILLFSAVTHIFKPRVTDGLIPNFLPKKVIHYIISALELILAVGLLISYTDAISALGITLIMVVFLPVHLLDLLKAQPAIGSKKVAWVRFLLQFVLISMAYYMWGELS
jgi:uncharacterized membrane protein